MPPSDASRNTAGPDTAGRSTRAVPLGSFAELSCQKIVFDLQLANLPVQKIDLRLAGHTLGCCAAAFENACRPVQQLLLPVVDLVRMNAEPPRKLAVLPPPLTPPQRPFPLEPRVVLLPCPFLFLLRAVALSR